MKDDCHFRIICGCLSDCEDPDSIDLDDFLLFGEELCIIEWGELLVRFAR